MNRVENTIDVAMLSVGSIYSLANIEHILGIIILVIQISWILCKFISKIVTCIKNKTNINELEDDVNDVVDTLTTLKDGDEDGGRKSQ